MNEVRRSAVAFLEELLGLFRREFTWGYPGWGLRALRFAIGGGKAQVGVSRVLGDVNMLPETGYDR
jgi:hypothetical protein